MALALGEVAWRGRCGALGEGHADALCSAHELGVALRLAGRGGEALPLARAAYAGRLALQGSGGRLTLASQLSLARLQGDSELASSILQAHADIQE